MAYKCPKCGSKKYVERVQNGKTLTRCMSCGFAGSHLRNETTGKDFTVVRTREKVHQHVTRPDDYILIAILFFIIALIMLVGVWAAIVR